VIRMEIYLSKFTDPGMVSHDADTFRLRRDGQIKIIG